MHTDTNQILTYTILISCYYFRIIIIHPIFQFIHAYNIKPLFHGIMHAINDRIFFSEFYYHLASNQVTLSASTHCSERSRNKLRVFQTVAVISADDTSIDPLFHSIPVLLAMKAKVETSVPPGRQACNYFHSSRLRALFESEMRRRMLLYTYVSMALW
jgi:hypothetical protein